MTCLVGQRQNQGHALCLAVLQGESGTPGFLVYWVRDPWKIPSLSQASVSSLRNRGIILAGISKARGASTLLSTLGQRPSPSVCQLDQPPFTDLESHEQWSPVGL